MTHDKKNEIAVKLLQVLAAENMTILECKDALYHAIEGLYYIQLSVVPNFSAIDLRLSLERESQHVEQE